MQTTSDSSILHTAAQGLSNIANHSDVTPAQASNSLEEHPQLG